MNKNHIPDPEIIEEEVKSGSFATFRRLLRQGIGDRTQGAFAEQAGVSRSTVSKMLNLKTIPRPEKKTLEAFARQMFSVSYADLCQACGYPQENILDIAAKVKAEILEGAASQRGALTPNSPADFLDTIGLLYLSVSCKWQPLHPEEKEIPDVPGEEKAMYLCSWEYGSYSCCTILAIGYSMTKNNRFVLNDIRVDGACLIPKIRKELEKTGEEYSEDLACIISEKKPKKAKSKEERLLSAIFGEHTEIVRTEIGCGFYYHHTPEKFDTFLMAHAGDFCTDKTTGDLYAKWTESGDRSLFDNYMGESGETGTGAVIAHILTVRTGKPFCYCEKETENGPDDACIFCTEGIDQENPQKPIDPELLRNVYFAASELDIEEFGQVCHQIVDLVSLDQVYNTKTYHLEFTGSN